MFQFKETFLILKEDPLHTHTILSFTESLPKESARKINFLFVCQKNRFVNVSLNNSELKNRANEQRATSSFTDQDDTDCEQEHDNNEWIDNNRDERGGGGGDAFDFLSCAKMNWFACSSSSCLALLLRLPRHNFHSGRSLMISCLYISIATA